MKILLVCEDLPGKMVGGLGKHVVTLGNALMAAGNEVTLMGHSGVDYEQCKAEMGFKGSFIAGFPHLIKGWKEKSLGFFNPMKRPYFAKLLAKGILEHEGQFDVIHYHGHLPMVARHIPKEVNFLQTRHDQGSDCITHVRFKAGQVCTERSASACATCIHPAPGAIRTRLSSIAVERYRREVVAAFQQHPVIFVSDFLRKNFIKIIPTAHLNKAHVIHNFVDEARLHAVCQTDAPPQTSTTSSSIRVHITGRLDEAKGIAPLLDLMEQRLPIGWHVDIYGDGPLMPAIKAKHSSKAVTFHGHRLYDETIAATSKATVVVVPSVCEESCGTVILEALRLGKICYALGRGGTPELVRYGATGQLRLFDNLESLVSDLTSTTNFTDQVGGESADVQAAINQLTALYSGKRS